MDYVFSYFTLSTSRMNRIIVDAFMGLPRSEDSPRISDFHLIRTNLNTFRRLTGLRFSEYIETQVIGNTLTEFKILDGWGFDVSSSDHFHVVLEIFPLF